MKKKSNDYEDEYCVVAPDSLKLTWFYFPTSHSKSISYKKIKGIYFERQDFANQLFVVKGWGMALSKCWWACDVIRNLHEEKLDGPVYYNVVVDCGEFTKKGFTCLDINAFLTAIKPKLGPDTILQNKLPF